MIIKVFAGNLFFLLVINVSYGLTIYDDFNRLDNQDISEGYEGGFVCYERPVTSLDQITTYNGEDEELYVEETEY